MTYSRLALCDDDRCPWKHAAPLHDPAAADRAAADHERAVGHTSTLYPGAAAAAAGETVHITAPTREQAEATYQRAIRYVCPTIGCECEGQGLPADEGAGLFCSICLRDLVPMTPEDPA